SRAACRLTVHSGSCPGSPTRSSLSQKSIEKPPCEEAQCPGYVMNVVEMPLEILFIIERVFPIARLPDAAPPFVPPGTGFGGPDEVRSGRADLLLRPVARAGDLRSAPRRGHETWAEHVRGQESCAELRSCRNAVIVSKPRVSRRRRETLGPLART